ncbi:MAG: hypothetical protein OXI77_05630 [Chloroflexota bacterium]|nr:hypothetical protein [Chloroflexota bacterium]MDE2908084.1 hypothetical protein [Chloroflexota bacterium]
MPADKSDQLALVQQYQGLVEAYEALDRRIDELVSASRVSRDEMSAADLRRYRELARQRAEMLSDMRLLEQQLDLSGDDAPGAD